MYQSSLRWMSLIQALQTDQSEGHSTYGRVRPFSSARSSPHTQPDDGLRGGGHDGREQPGPECARLDVAGGVIVVLLLFGNDGRDRSDSSGVTPLQRHQLLLQVPEYDALHRHRRGRDGAGSQKTRDEAKEQATEAAKPIAATAWAVTTAQLCPKDGTVALLVRTEFFEFIDQAGCGQARHEELPAIDVDGAMLAGVIHLEDAVAQVVRCRRARDCVHAVKHQVSVPARRVRFERLAGRACGFAHRPRPHDGSSLSG